MKHIRIDKSDEKLDINALRFLLAECNKKSVIVFWEVTCCGDCMALQPDCTCYLTKNDVEYETVGENCPLIVIYGNGWGGGKTDFGPHVEKSCETCGQKCEQRRLIGVDFVGGYKTPEYIGIKSCSDWSKK